MKILIMERIFNKYEIVESDCVPRIGDSIPIWWTPIPVVKDVIWLSIGKQQNANPIINAFFSIAGKSEEMQTLIKTIDVLIITE